MAGKLQRLSAMFGPIKGLSFYMRYKLFKNKPVHPSFLKHPVYFRPLTTLSDHLMFEQIFYTKEYNISVPIQPKIIFDIGANVGFAAIYFANRFPQAHILSVEPELNNLQQAKLNTGAYNNINMLHGAIWHKEEALTIMNKGFGEASFMVTPGKAEALQNLPVFTIPVLMKYSKVATIDILKIDIEGAEKELFEQNFSEWLPHTKILIVETHDRYKAGTSRSIFNAVNTYDFGLEVSGENLVFYNKKFITEW